MARKDPVKSREYQKRIYAKERYIKEHPNVKRHDSYHDFETHRELAMNSGIESMREWAECSRRGLLPDGIYSHPEDVFRRK